MGCRHPQQCPTVLAGEVVHSFRCTSENTGRGERKTKGSRPVLAEECDLYGGGPASQGKKAFMGAGGGEKQKHSGAAGNDRNQQRVLQDFAFQASHRSFVRFLESIALD